VLSVRMTFPMPSCKSPSTVTPVRFCFLADTLIAQEQHLVVFFPPEISSVEAPAPESLILLAFSLHFFSNPAGVFFFVDADLPNHSPSRRLFESFFTRLCAVIADEAVPLSPRIAMPFGFDHPVVGFERFSHFFRGADPAQGVVYPFRPVRALFWSSPLAFFQCPLFCSSRCRENGNLDFVFPPPFRVFL